MASGNTFVPNNPRLQHVRVSELWHSFLWSLPAIHLVGNNVNHREHLLLLNYTTEGFRLKANENVQAQTRTKLSIILPIEPFSLLLANSGALCIKEG